MTVFPTWIDRTSLLWSKAEIDLLVAKSDSIMNSLGEKHLSWWEHKGSNECRICDLLVINSRLVSLILSKSVLDGMNESDHNSETEPDVGDVPPGEPMSHDWDDTEDGEQEKYFDETTDDT